MTTAVEAIFVGKARQYNRRNGPIARLGDPTEASFPAGGILPRHQTEPGGKMPNSFERTMLNDESRPAAP
jgi:hypothetical protein